MMRDDEEVVARGRSGGGRCARWSRGTERARGWRRKSQVLRGQGGEGRAASSRHASATCRRRAASPASSDGLHSLPLEGAGPPVLASSSAFASCGRSGARTARPHASASASARRPRPRRRDRGDRGDAGAHFREARSHRRPSRVAVDFFLLEDVGLDRVRRDRRRELLAVLVDRERDVVVALVERDHDGLGGGRAEGGRLEERPARRDAAAVDRGAQLALRVELPLGRGLAALAELEEGQRGRQTAADGRRESTANDDNARRSSNDDAVALCRFTSPSSRRPRSWASTRSWGTTHSWREIQREAREKQERSTRTWSCAPS